MPTRGRDESPSLFPPEPLRLPALRMRQGRDRVLYAFAVDGKRVEAFATVSRLSRDADRKVIGYQRPEVLSHVAEIREYLESDNPMLPNAVVIAFDPTVRFEPLADAPRTRRPSPANSSSRCPPRRTAASRGGSWTASSGWRRSARRCCRPASRCGSSGSSPAGTRNSASSSSW